MSLEEAYANKKILEDALLEVNVRRYNPKTSTYKTWYGLPVKLEAVEKGRLIQHHYLTKLRIPPGKKGKDELLSEFLHEVGHLELLPIEMSLLPLALHYVSINSPTMGDELTNSAVNLTLTSVAGILYVVGAREATAELYCMLKMGYKRYRKAWKDFRNSVRENQV